MVGIPEQRACDRDNREKQSEPEKSQYPALGIMVEYLCAFPEVPDIFHRVKNGGILLREDVDKLPEFGSRDDHENNRNSVRKTAGTFDSCHPVAKPGEICDKRLRVIRSDQPDNHMPERDYLLDLHAEECANPVAGEISKQVPVVRKIREDKTGGKEPDTRLGDADAGSQVRMPACDIDSPDGFKTCLDYPGYEDEQGDCRSDPEDTSTDNVSLPAGIIDPGC
jgi:hypothetical protein